MKYLTPEQLEKLSTADKLAYIQGLEAMTKKLKADNPNLKRFSVWESKDKAMDDGSIKHGTGRRYLQFKATSGGKAILLTKAQVEEIIKDSQDVLNAIKELKID